ncbi:MAG: HIT domain-containing protein [Chloroflexi bacterium]|nr:HIT domain-containing protein [Chloroflexota bacterium]
MSAWPLDYREQLLGAVCSLCAEGRPEEAEGRIRFFSSKWSDGYLHLRGVQRGFAAVIWRGRHVVEPTELSEEDAAAFWFDVLRVGRAMQVVYRPLKLNYQLLGNRIPHLHWLVAPRFLDDVAPGGPLPGSGYHDFPEDAVRWEVAMLRELLTQMT